MGYLCLFTIAGKGIQIYTDRTWVVWLFRAIPARLLHSKSVVPGIEPDDGGQFRPAQDHGALVACGEGRLAIENVVRGVASHVSRWVLDT